MKLTEDQSTLTKSQIKKSPMEAMMPIFRERLAEGQSIRFSPQGTSMLPMLREGIDNVVISPLPEMLQKYDIVLYQRDNGQYVLHRIVETGETYTCIGDNQFVKETGLRADQMIALVTGFDRNGREHKTSEYSYQLYCRVWNHSRHIRHFWRRGMRWLKRHIRHSV